MNNNIELYSEGKNYTLYRGNMLNMLDVIAPNSIDSIVCDPPYELNFMNKGWDNSGISFDKNTWQKCFQVLRGGGYLLVFGGSRTYHRIACAIEDAGFEIRDCIMYLYGCYSSDTQVLTNKGWKYFYELDKTEKVLQWNKNTDKLSWVKPLNYFEYDVDEELVFLQNRHTEQLITKNHKVVCDIKKNQKQYHNKYDYIEAQDILKSDCVKLPLASYYYGDLHYDYAYIIGWFLTDAWVHKDGKAVCFSQSKKGTLVKLRNELERLKRKGLCEYSEYIKKSKIDNQQDEHSFYVTGKIANYLINKFPNREFKEEFIELDKKSKDKLLEGLMDGDGSCRRNSYSYTFWSKKDFRNDILSAMLTTMGYRNYISYSNGHRGVVFNTKHRTTEIQYKHKKENVKYSGTVYCLQTETGAFVVRRKGKPFISGNSGFPKSMDVGLAIDKKNGVANRTGNIAQNEWQGWGTNLKPAYEPIIVARKPFKGTLVNNIIKNGVGALNIDECRVGNEEKTQYSGKSTNGTVCFDYPQNNAHFETVIGRFPANVITDGSEEVQNGLPETKSNGGNYSMKDFSQFKGSMMHFTNQKSESQKSRIVSDKKLPIDSGNACRYFYCAKASTKDREEGLIGFEKQQTTDGCIRSNEETARKFGANSGLRKNIHPTVKPTALMQYLIKLVSPKGSIILDPFMGSGSTGKAVMFENNERNANYKFIGIELATEYLPICEARIKWASEQNMIIGKNNKENK